jgi:hypothetical protein
MNFDQQLKLAVVVVGTAAVGYIAYRATSIGGAVTGELEDFFKRRARDSNLVSSVANTVTEVVTVDRNQTVGGAVFDLLNTYDEESGLILGPFERLARSLGLSSSADRVTESNDRVQP